MKLSAKMLVALLLGTLVCCSSLPAAEEPAAKETPTQETPAQRDARLKWWREARFGMFIHWGVYSVPAGTYNGKKIGGIGEWIMNSGKIPTAEYQKYAKEFNPVKFNADQWVKTAKEAGMKYIVITSKHHDGFAMFDSKASDWNIVKASPFGRDPLKELAAACQKNGIKLGFYYSQAQDWNNPGGAAAGGHWDKAQDGSMDKYIEKVAVPQVKEILTNYGPIAVLWWDTPCDMTKERAEKFLPLLKLQPGIIMNNRLGGGFDGDSETPEQEIPATGFPNRDWETCMTMNDTWGYKSYDHNWKSTETLIRNLVDIASKGGNYLLNVGPTSEGLIPEASVERLKEVGKWMKVNGESIYATTASPFKKLPWGRCTKKIHDGGATLYLQVFDWPKDGKLVVPGLMNSVKKAYLLADSEKKPLSVEMTNEGADLAWIVVPQTAPDKICSVVVLEVNGNLQIENPLPTQDAAGRITLNAADAVCHGEEVKTEERDGKTNIGFWTNPADSVEWEFKVTKPGKFTITVETAALESGNFKVNVVSEKTEATPQAVTTKTDKRWSASIDAAASQTGDYSKFETVTLCELLLPAADKNTLTVKPVADGWHPMNLRCITLTPVK
jgi:alpha-L-fucosidase